MESTSRCVMQTRVVVVRLSRNEMERAHHGVGLTTRRGCVFVEDFSQNITNRGNRENMRGYAIYYQRLVSFSFF